MASHLRPTLQRREFGSRLQEIRREAGMTVDEVAAYLMCSAAKISRIEKAPAGRGVSLRDVRDLCDLYQVDSAERECREDDRLILRA